MEFSVISVTMLFSLLALFILTRAEEDYPKVLYLEINGEKLERPLLPDLKTRLLFPMKSIDEASLDGHLSTLTKCIFWSDKDFTWASFGLNRDLEAVFPNANQLICYDYDEGYFPMMVEDMSGNQMLLKVYSHNVEYHIAEFKMPINVRRAVPLMDDQICEFRSRKSFSAKFHEDLVSEPFKEAIEVYCTDM